MADVAEHLNCTPQGNFVTEERVKKFSGELKPEEKAHYILPIQIINLENRKKMRCTLNGLLLVTQKRILVLYRKTLGEDKYYELDYSDYTSIEEYGKINLNPKYTFKSTSREDKIKIAATIKNSNPNDLSAAIQFIKNAINGSKLDSEISQEEDSNDEASKNTVESEATGELRRTCKSCGNIWHVDKEEIEELENQRKNSKIAGALTAMGGNLATSSISNRNKEEAKKRLKKLNKCPECRSSNYKEEKVKSEDLEEKSEIGNSTKNSSKSSRKTGSADINYCPQCGQKIQDENAAYCSKCGSKLK